MCDTEPMKIINKFFFKITYNCGLDLYTPVLWKRPLSWSLLNPILVEQFTDNIYVLIRVKKIHK